MFKLSLIKRKAKGLIDRFLIRGGGVNNHVAVVLNLERLLFLFSRKSYAQDLKMSTLYKEKAS